MKSITTNQKRDISVTALLGIIVVTLNTRAAITSLSPIFDIISKSFPISAMAQSVLGMLPPIAFAIFGWLAPKLLPKFGLEKSLFLAMVLVFIGVAARSLSSSILIFAGFYLVSLAGMGISNVLLPPTIKDYFPTHIGPITSVYTAVVPISTSLPSMLAVPVSLAMGWRFSTGMWSLLAIAAMIPWLMLKGNHKQVFNRPKTKTGYRLWRQPTVWALTVLFSVGVLNTYAMISWMPKLLISLAGVESATAGLMLSAFSFAGFIPAILVPLLLVRSRRPFYVVLFFTCSIVLGFFGLLFFPKFAWIWVIMLGFGPTLIPIGLTLINLRSRTADGTAALSGFVQGVGYLMGAVGPLAFGSLYTLTDQWMPSIGFLMVTALIATIAGIFAIRSKFIEDFPSEKISALPESES